MRKSIADMLDETWAGEVIRLSEKDAEFFVKAVLPEEAEETEEDLKQERIKC